MSERARERRRSKGRDDAEPAPSGRVDPRQAQLLALQRSAGNRAVQRLVFTQQTRKLRVPDSYANRRIPWENGYLRDRDVKNGDPTFLELANRDNGALLPHVARGIGVKSVEGVNAMPDAAMTAGIASLADATAAAGTVPALQAVAPAADRVLMYPGSSVKYFDPSELDTHHVMQPKDFFPEESDLPASGFGVRQQLIGQMKGQKLWNLVCVLIALVKAEGYGPVQQITGQNTNTLDAAVQALHDHYRTQGVEYDDSSTRMTIMDAWGYHLIHSGKVAWADVPSRVALNAGTYIFDTEDHTVKVDVLQNIALGGGQIANLGQYFKCHSDKANYIPSEFLKDVIYIWSK